MKARCVFVLMCCFSAAGGKEKPVPVSDFVKSAFSLSEVMLHDVVNPPAASRFYAYCMLGAYQALNQIEREPFDLPSRFKIRPNFSNVPVPSCVSKDFVAAYAMLEVGRQLMPSGYLLEQTQTTLFQDFKKKYHFSSPCLEQNIAFATTIAAQVVEYSKTDGYSKLSTLKRYSPVVTDGHWYPTPPEYMAAVEPHWRTIRPFFLDSAQQIISRRAAQFSEDKDSPFGKLTYEVYDISKKMTAEQRAIAGFWDCNPFAVQYSGHAAIGIKKISPGGHWMGITGIACVTSSASIEKTVLAYALVALTLHDAFISCWHVKYQSDRVRPETVINKYIDPSWRPLLQTPPFPENTSGHSVISTASASILTFLFGDNFKFVDTSEEFFGLPARNFGSFHQAAAEAGISRLYGGIHFRDSIENGQEQGEGIGQAIVQKIQGIGRP